MARILVALVALACVPVASGCGEDTERLAREARARGEQVRQRAESIRERGERIRGRGERARDQLTRHVRDVLEDIRQSVPRATPETRPPAARGRAETSRVDAYLTEVVQSVDAYWTRTLAVAELEAPSVSYVWVPRGRAVRTACRVVAGDDAAFYCPADDTIYVAEKFASDLWQGISDDFPGQRSGQARAVGDFGLAYVVAHEYAHNVQQELGFYTLRPQLGTKPFELQADCMAGLWGNSVYREGLLQPGDV
ncbi:MAG: neutral zinc metallopeptidase, partial [Thermoleophilaceae bacterium]|nr:neutral zinc metallopeptidase [Thermoleophilaceae bacterium]